VVIKINTEKNTIKDIIESAETLHIPDNSKNEIDNYCDVKIKQITKKLCDLRKQRGLSITQLAEKADITPNHVYKIEKEHCNISVKVLLKLCKGLEVKVSDVIQEENYMQRIQIIDTFEHLVEDLTVKEKNAILAVVQMCRIFKES